MKIFRWMVFLLVVALISYYYHSQKNVSPEVPIQSKNPEKSTVLPVVEKPVVSEPVAPNIQSAPSVQASSPSKVASNGGAYREKPKDLFVHFELVDGYAVAYGDTILGKPTKDFHESSGLAELRPVQYWPRGEIPYAISSDLPNPERVTATIELFQQKTNIRFIPFTGQADAIIFMKGDSNCASYLGKVGEHQPIFLSEKCLLPEISHELMHALGFIHEQSRVDRDSYIEVLWNNIETAFQSQYAIVPEPLMDSLFDSPFNSNSIMMYSARMFAIEPEVETMRAKGGAAIVPPPRSLSEVDIARINRLYPK